MGGQRYDWAKLDADLVAMRRKGKSFVVIARRLGITPSAAQRRFRFLTGERDLNRSGAWRPSGELLQMRAVIAQAFAVSDEDIVGTRRWREIAHARQAACWVIRQVRPQLSYPCLGVMMGNRDHTTIIHAVRQVEERRRRDADLATMLDALVTMFRRRSDVRQYDAHVCLWRAVQTEGIRAAALAALRKIEAEREAEERARSDDEFVQAIDPRKRFCGQCDRAVLPAEAARCAQRLCPSRVASTQSRTGAAGTTSAALGARNAANGDAARPRVAA